MKKVIKLLAMCSCALWAIQVFAYAAEIPFELKLKDKQVGPGRQTYLDMIFANEPKIPAPQTPFIKDLNISYVKWDTQNVIVGGKNVLNVIHSYRVVGVKTGIYTIGPITVEYNGNTYRSNSVMLEITKNLSQPQSGYTPSGAALDISKRVYLKLEVPKTELYVNEQIPISLNFYSDWFSLGDMSGGKISGDDLIISDYYAKSSKMIKPADLTYLVISRQALLSAPSAGGFTIKPIVVRIDLVNYKKDAAIATFGKVVIQDKENFRGKMASINNNSDYYDTFIGPVGKRQIELKTEPVNITAIPLPKEGQPDGFSGAVGDFSLDYSASSTEAKLGGYVTLKMVIKGDGNYSTVTCPRLEKASGIKPAEPRLTKGEKTATYEQVLRIQTQEVSELPRVTFNFFSPIEKKYKTITKGPLPIQISGAVAGADIMEEEAKRLEAKKEWVEGLKNITLPMKTRSTPFYRSRSFLIFEAAPIFIVVLGIFLALVMRYLKDHPLYAASFKASRRAETGISRAESLLAKGAPAEFYEQVFRTLQEYLGTRRLKPTEGVTGNILNEIDVAGIDKEVIGKINSIFHECYLVRYAETAPGKDEMHKVMESVKFVVDKLNEKTEL